MKLAPSTLVVRKAAPAAKRVKGVRGASVKSFAAAAEKFRGMLKNGPTDLSMREGFGR